MARAPTDIRSMARSYSRKAIKVLAGIMQAEDAAPPARVAAASALLDRGWGKPSQPLTGDGGGPILQRIERVIVESPANPNGEGVPPAG